MRFWRNTVQDVRFAIRSVRRTPLVAGMAVLSLALGIGANTAVFSIIDRVMLRSLAVHDPDRLVVLERVFQGRGGTDAMTYPAFERMRDAQVFAAMTASATIERSGVRPSGVTAPDPAAIRVGLVSGNYFEMLGVRAVVGRTLAAEDERAGAAAPVAVIGAPYWRRVLSAAPDVIGRTITVSGSTFAIVGVIDGRFTGEDLGEVTDVWIPISHQSAAMPERTGLLQNSSSNWIRGIGRLRPGQTVAQAEAAYAAILTNVAPLNPAFGKPRLVLGPAGRGFSAARERLAAPLAVLGVVVALVLLLACGNVAMLVLARAASREKEFAMRLALGAARARLAGQVLRENLVLVVVSGAVGLLVAVWMTSIFGTLASSGRAATPLDTHLDLRMVAVAALVSVLTGVVFGAVPALRAARVSLVSSLTGARSASRGAWAAFGSGRALVVVQVAASIALVIGAVLFVRTLRNLEGGDIGFDLDHVWMFWLAPGEAGRQGAALAPAFAEAQARVSALPGVVSASVSSDGVLSGFIGLRTVTAEGHVNAPDEDASAQWNLVAPHFFETIGMRLVAGRDIGPQDTENAPAVAVVNETMARHFFGDANPIGKRFTFGRNTTRSIEIVGLVHDAKYFSPRDEATAMVFLPYRQELTSLFRMCVVARLATTSPSLVARISAELRAVDPDVPLRLVNTTADQLDRTLSDERLTAWFAGAFSVLALVLAAVGLYGVMAYTTSRRVREIGIRLALGETRGRVLRRVLAGGLTLVGAGVVIGAPAGLLAVRSVRSMLFGVAPADSATIAGAVALLLVVAVAATLMPARRAAAVDPVTALRAE